MSIRKTVLVLAFLSTTALTPVAVQADPVTVSLGAMYAASAGTAYLAAGAGLYGLTAFAVSSMGFLGTALISSGLSYAVGRLTNKKASVPYTAQMGNYAQPVSYMQRGYGTVRTGGVFGFSAFKNDGRYYTILLAAHSTAGPVTHYLSDIEVEVDPSDHDVITAPIAGNGTLRPFMGQPGQTAEPDLTTHFPEVTEAFDFAGLSGAYIWARRVSAEDLQTVYPDGDIWTYAPVWRMNDRIYDPRTGSYVWSDNWALCFAHEIVTYLGGGVDWDEVATEADFCDELVTNADGGLQRRWTFSRVFSDDQDWDTICAEFIAAADGFVFERPDGKVGFRCGRWIEPTVTLTAKDFLAPQFSTGRDMGANSQYVVKYAEPLNMYKETVSGAYVYDAAVRRVTSETEVYGIGSHNQAFRIAKRLARQEHAEFTLSTTLNLSGFKLMGHRFFRLVHPEMGLDRTFEVSKLVRSESGTGFTLEARSVDPDDFAADAALEEPARPRYEQVVSDDATPDVVGVTASVLAASNGSAAIVVAWQPYVSSGGVVTTIVRASLRQQVRIRSVEAGIEEWQVQTIALGQSEFVATGLVDGALYEVQVRNYSTSKPSSAWLPETPLYVRAVANTKAPGIVSGFDADVEGSDVVLTWSAPNTAEYFGTRLYRATYETAPSSPVIADAAVIRVEYGVPSAADQYTDPAPGTGHHYYWAEAINQSGIAGPVSGPRHVIIS